MCWMERCKGGCFRRWDQVNSKQAGRQRGTCACRMALVALGASKGWRMYVPGCIVLCGCIRLCIAWRYLWVFVALCWQVLLVAWSCTLISQYMHHCMPYFGSTWCVYAKSSCAAVHCRYRTVLLQAGCTAWLRRLCCIHACVCCVSPDGRLDSLLAQGHGQPIMLGLLLMAPVGVQVVTGMCCS